MKRALFLDRDGVINVNHGYVHKPDNFDFIDGIFDVCRLASQRGYLLVVVTNQAGIGRGYYDEDTFHGLTQWMHGQFRLHGVEITQVYFCPDHPKHGIGRYKRESFFRKPAPGMILQALADHGISAQESLLVGDSATDLQAGQAAAIADCILFDEQGSFSEELRTINRLPQLATWLHATDRPGPAQ